MMRSDNQAYEIIKNYILKHHYAPSFVELAKELDCSTDTARARIHNLIRDGKLESDNPGESRAIRIPEFRFKLPEEEIKGISSEILGL